MTQLEVKQQTAQKLEAISKQAKKTVDEVVDWLLVNYGHTLVADESNRVDDAVWTDTELAAVMQTTPLTGKEMVEQGFTGGWEHKQIDDPVAFLKQQRATRRKEKFE